MFKYPIFHQIPISKLDMPVVITKLNMSEQEILNSTKFLSPLLSQYWRESNKNPIRRQIKKSDALIMFTYVNYMKKSLNSIDPSDIYLSELDSMLTIYGFKDGWKLPYRIVG